MKPYGIRDKIVYAIASMVLRLASRRYQQVLRGVWIYGLQAAARDARAGSPPPPPWYEPLPDPVVPDVRSTHTETEETR